MRYRIMSIIRRQVDWYIISRGTKPKRIYLSAELVSRLTDEKRQNIEEGFSNIFFDSENYIIPIYVASSKLGDEFNCVGSDRDYDNAVERHTILNGTDSIGKLNDEANNSIINSDNVVRLFRKRNGSV